MLEQCPDTDSDFFLLVASVPDDEWNLLYVAVTRAKRALYITKTISNLLTFTGVSYYYILYYFYSIIIRISFWEDVFIICEHELFPLLVCYRSTS